MKARIKRIENKLRPPVITGIERIAGRFFIMPWKIEIDEDDARL